MHIKVLDHFAGNVPQRNCLLHCLSIPGLFGNPNFVLGNARHTANEKAAFFLVGNHVAGLEPYHFKSVF